jgi:hypothetical protein
MMAATLVDRTDQELADMLALMGEAEGHTLKARLASAAISEIVLERHPEFGPVLQSWAEDLDNELSLAGLAVQFLHRKLAGS